MPKAKDQRIGKAKQLYEQGLLLVDISKILDVPEGTVRSWKNRYEWGACDKEKKTNATLRKKLTSESNVAKVRGSKLHGGQVGNKNSKGKQNALKHGVFARYIPEDTLEIMGMLDNKEPEEILWDNIQISYAAIIRAQQIMYVVDIEDSTTSQVGYKDSDMFTEERWEIQHAWDKQANFLKAQSRAQGELRSMIKQYVELCASKDMNEERRLRVDKLRLQVRNLGGDDKELGKVDALLEAINNAAKS